MTRIPQEAARGKLGAWRGGKERLGDQVRDFPSIQTSSHFPFPQLVSNQARSRNAISLENLVERVKRVGRASLTTRRGSQAPSIVPPRELLASFPLRGLKRDVGAQGQLIPLFGSKTNRSRTGRSLRFPSTISFEAI